MLMLRTITHEAPERRGRRPETIAALDERDRLLSECAARFMPDQSARAAAHRLHLALSNYQLGPWRRERTSSAPPAHRCDRLDGFCWRILRARDHLPSERVIRRAIDAAKKFS
jgi:hypothetical protein